MIDFKNLSSKKTHQELLKNEYFQIYEKGLSLYWNGSFYEAADYISNEILNGPENDFTFSYYRLWIECLCEVADHYSLGLLSKHLLKRSLADNHQSEWIALRSIVHLELDEWDACELNHELLDCDGPCNFSLEFLQRYYLRISPAEDEIRINFENATSNIIDYFHWRCINQILLLSGAEEELIACLQHVKRIFQQSPMYDRYFSYLYIDQNRLAEALFHSQALKNSFPNNTEFSYLHGYIQRSLGDFKKSVKTFQNLTSNLPDDPDIYSELAYCHFKKSENDIFSFHWEKAVTYHNKAISLYKQLGLPLSQVSLNKERQTNFSESKNHSENLTPLTQPINYWLIELSQRRFSEIATFPDEAIETLLRPMGKNPKINDLVFFAVENPIQKQQLRLSALYFVEMNPVWHPYQGSHVGLRLVKKFSDPIFLDAAVSNLLDRRSKKRLSSLGTEGVFELNESAFDLIREAISECTLDSSDDIDFSNIYMKQL